VVHQPIVGLRLADTVIPDLAEVLFLPGRHRARLRIAGIEKAVAVPRDRRELDPVETIGEGGSRRHVMQQQLLHIAAVPRQAVDDAIAGLVGFEDRDRRGPARVEQVRIDEDCRGLQAPVSTSPVPIPVPTRTIENRLRPCAVALGEEDPIASDRRYRHARHAVQLAQPRRQAVAQRRIQQASGERVLFGHPGRGRGVVRGLEGAERIGDGDAVERVDEIATRSRRIAVRASDHFELRPLSLGVGDVLPTTINAERAEAADKPQQILSGFCGFCVERRVAPQRCIEVPTSGCWRRAPRRRAIPIRRSGSPSRAWLEASDRAAASPARRA
jgi:hypothetical protein